MPDNNTSMEGSDPMLAQALRDLPLPALRDSAWPAIAATLAARQRRARWRVAAPALAAALVGGVALNLMLRPLPTPVDPVVDAVAVADAAAASATHDLISRNQALEAMLRDAGGASAQNGAAALASAELEDLIGMLDLQLGAATDPRESDALWQERLVLMQELAQLRAPSARLADNGGAMQPAAYLVD